MTTHQPEFRTVPAPDHPGQRITYCRACGQGVRSALPRVLDQFRRDHARANTAKEGR